MGEVPSDSGHIDDSAFGITETVARTLAENERGGAALAVVTANSSGCRFGVISRDFIVGCGSPQAFGFCSPENVRGAIPSLSR